VLAGGHELTIVGKDAQRAEAGAALKTLPRRDHAGGHPVGAGA
jgi:hypothetical protein